jgi:hypothetical protein
MIPYWDRLAGPWPFRSKHLSQPAKTARPRAESWGRGIENSSTRISTCHNVVVIKIRCSRDVGRDIVVHEVGRLQVEEASLTDVVADIWFVAIVAESLTPAFLLFNWRGTTKLASKAAGFCRGLPAAQVLERHLLQRRAHRGLI